MSGRSLRRIAFVCLLALLLAGCERLYNGTYISVTEHEEPQLYTGTTEQYYEVHTYSGIRNALLELVSCGAAEGLIRTQDYAGSVQDDVARICLDVTRETAIGSYAVAYISHTVTRILSYDEIRLNISYRIGQEELSAVQSISSQQELYRLMESAMNTGKEKLAVQIATLSANQQLLLEYAEDYYRQQPELLSAKPAVTVTFYPSEEHVSKIIEFSFAYSHPPEDELERLERLRAAADAITDNLGPLDETEAVLLCCQALAERAELQKRGNTAYDALVAGSADPEGFAMAFQLLCSRLGVSCQVVEGKKDGRTHFWNIVKFGQEYGHVDSSACFEEPVVCILPDEAMIGEYWWDVERYPRCEAWVEAPPAAGDGEPASSESGTAERTQETQETF